MKAVLTIIMLASASALAQPTAPKPTLIPGSEVNLSALNTATWVQGEPLTAFEPGKLYMFECWATWCGPCIAAIPHVNELHKKYYDKGLRVYGISVREGDLEKVKQFVAKKGDGMAYPVAYTGNESPFKKDWLDAASAPGIPFSFLVKDGKLVLASHPNKLSDDIIEKLLSEDGNAESIAASMAEDEAKQAKAIALMKEIAQAQKAQNAVALEAKITEYEVIFPNDRRLDPAKLILAVFKKDWPAATKKVAELPKNTTSLFTIMQLAGRASGTKGDEFPVEFVQALLDRFDIVTADPRMSKNPVIFYTLSSLQWRTGDKEAAIASAKKGIEVAASPENKSNVSTVPFERLAAGMEAGTPPTPAEFFGWVNAEIKAKQEAAAASRAAGSN